jgi:TRAP-type uncharacterized transport system substrate-binding protein
LAAALAVVLAPLLTHTACAQTGPKGSVTIFTDGMAAPNGPMARALTELSGTFDKGKKLRVLPIMAQGGEDNVRDLLRFRGADLAVVNSDVFAAPSVLKNYPEAQRKLRAITRLRSQKAFLFARPEITTVDQLAGRKVVVFGPETISGLTAATVFELLKVKVEIVHAEEGVDLAPPPDAQAVFILEDEAKRLLPAIVPELEFRLIAIPRDAGIAKFYNAAAIQPAEAGAYGGAEAVSTISVDTILATFDWAPTQARFPDVSAFIDRLFAALPELRRDYPASIWQDTDPMADVLGWRRYDHAETARRTVVAATPPAGDAPPVPVKPGGANATSSGTPLRLSIVAHPPLTDQHAPAGGLIGELTIAAMERADPPYNRNIAFLWEKDRTAQVKTVLSDKGADLGVPWETASCDDPRQLGAAGAAFCDGALASEPLFKVLVLFFIGAESDFSFTGDDSLAGRTICIPADRDVSSLGEAGRKLVADDKLTLVRPATLIECLDTVQRNEADAVLTNELEGRLTISRLGLSKAFRMADRAVSTQDIEIILAKNEPGAEQLLAALNKGIAKLKAEDLYSRIVAKHLAQINAGN